MYYQSTPALIDRWGASFGGMKSSAFWLGGLAFVSISATVFLLGTRYGIGILPDSTRYMGMSPNPYDAPLYPWLLMAVAATGIDIVAGAKLIGLLLVCANTLLIWQLLARTTGRYGYAAVGTALIIASPQFVALHSVAMSEPLFILLILATLQMLLEFWETERTAWLVACGVAIGLASLARFAAPALGAAAVLTLILDPRRRFSRRLVEAGIVTAASAAIFLFWTALSQMIVGRSIGRPLHLYGNMDAESWASSLKALTVWLVPGEVPPVFRVTLFGLVMVGIVWLAVGHARRVFWNPGDATAGRAMLPIMLSLFLPCYLGFMVVATSIEANLALSGRYAFPVYLTTVLMITVILADTGPLREPSGRLHVILIVFAFLLLTSHAIRTADRTRQDYAEGIGYASLSWARSPVMRAVRRLPVDAVIYSDGPDVITYLTGRSARQIPERIHLRIGMEDPANPFEKQIQNTGRQLARGNSFVVFIDGIDWRFYLASERDLVRLLDLKLVDREQDGRIYARNPISLRQSALGRSVDLENK